VKHIYRTFGSVSITGKIEGEIVRALGKDGVGVKSISHNGSNPLPPFPTIPPFHRNRSLA
jgi:hypothetical protein